MTPHGTCFFESQVFRGRLDFFWMTIPVDYVGFHCNSPGAARHTSPRVKVMTSVDRFCWIRTFNFRITPGKLVFHPVKRLCCGWSSTGYFTERMVA